MGSVIVVHGLVAVRHVESSHTMDRTRVPCVGRRILLHCATREVQMLSFKPTFSLSSFTFIKRLFSSSSLFAIRVVSSAYLRLLIFFLAILIPACDSFSLAFQMVYSAYKLNKQCDNIQPCCIGIL